VRIFKISSFCKFELDSDGKKSTQTTIFFNNYCGCGYHVLAVREFCEQVSNYEHFRQDSVALNLPKFHSLLATIKEEEEEKKPLLFGNLRSGDCSQCNAATRFEDREKNTKRLDQDRRRHRQIS
jgi:hypothetical protein